MEFITFFAIPPTLHPCPLINNVIYPTEREEKLREGKERHGFMPDVGSRSRSVSTTKTTLGMGVLKNNSFYFFVFVLL
jgi:hypothetical protein